MKGYMPAENQLRIFKPEHEMLGLWPGYPGSVWYQEGFLAGSDCRDTFQILQTKLPWQQDRIRMFGKEILTRRKTAWFGDQPFAYRYSGFTRLALAWHPLLLEIRNRLRQDCKVAFNSCLANFYHDGSEGMGWHSDDEDSLDPESPIASISLGAGRRFLFRLKENHRIRREFRLENGSLLLMDALSQQCWQHSLPVQKGVLMPRINLTFRVMKRQSVQESRFAI